MTKREELEIFVSRADEFIDSSYILADIKIANLLKSIAVSDTLLAIFKNCLNGFDYVQAQKVYLVKNKYLPGEKGQFVLPPNSREILAFIFNFLVDVDAKRVDFAEFIQKYFYEDGSFSSGYSAFLNGMIKPFKSAVISIMEKVIEGKIQDPVEAISEQEAKKLSEQTEEKLQREKDKELSKKAYGNSIKTIKNFLLVDKTKIRESKLKDAIKEEILLVVDMLANVVEGEDKDAIKYAFTAYKYCAKAYKFKFWGRARKIQKLLKDVTSEL